MKKLSRKDLEIVLRKYDLGKFKASQRFEYGVCNDVVKVDTESGQYVVRVWNPMFRKGLSLMYEINLLRRLSSNGVPCQRPVKTVDGKYVVNFAGTKVAVFEYIEGHHIMNPEVEHIKQIGKQTARMHNVIIGYRPRGKRNTFKQRSFIPFVDRMLRWLAAEPIKNHEVYESAAKETLKDLVWPKDVPKGAIHNDLHPDNVLFRGGEFVAFIDFDDSYYGPLIHDIGLALMNLSFTKHRVDYDKIRAFLGSYNAERKMSAQEWRCLYDVMRIESLSHATYKVSGALHGARKKDCNNSNTKNLRALNQITKQEFLRKVR